MTTTGVHAVDLSLDRVTVRWRRRLLLRRSAILGACLCGLYLVLAGAVLSGGIVQPAVAMGSAIGIPVLGAVAWLILAVVALDTRPSRQALSTLVEQGHPRLLDRLHTLIALEGNRSQPEVAPFYRRIARQAQAILVGDASTVRLSARPLFLPSRLSWRCCWRRSSSTSASRLGSISWRPGGPPSRPPRRLPSPRLPRPNPPGTG